MAASRRASLLLRPSSYYRRDQFRAGLERHGFTVDDRPARNPSSDDVLLMWNRNRSNEGFAQAYERAGARILIAENGYLPHPNAKKGFALALGHHNGAGRWFVGDRPRVEFPEQPWRASGEHVLVLPQRGIGERGVAMPNLWLARIRDRLKHITDRPIIIRPHPGASNPAISLEQQLQGAHCVVTWGSGGAIKALLAGVPVFHDFPRWIGKPASAPLAKRIEGCITESREELWRRVSWAQWSLEEIGSGEALDGLLNVESRDLFCAG